MRKILFLFALTGAYPALGQDGGQPIVLSGERTVDETSITVTATGVRSEVEDTGQAVSVIGRAEIEEVQGADVVRVLERVPGVTYSRNGAPGGFTGLRVRGADAEQLVVVVDGIRQMDPAAPAGGFDFGNLAAGTLEKIELLRGSNSTIWGSDAIGGVLVASTRAESGLRGSGEYGADDSAYLTASGGIGGPGGFLGGSAGWYRTDGFSSAAGGSEADGFDQAEGNAQGRLYLSDVFEVFARGRYARGRLDLDGFVGFSPIPVDTAEYQVTRQWSGAAGAVYDSGVLYVAGDFSLADTERENFNPAAGAAPGYTTDGTSRRLALRGEWRAIGPLLVDFGASREWSRFSTLFDPARTTAITGAYAQLGIEFGAISGHLGARQDDHRDFGGATSLGADISWEAAPDLRLRASIGEGFKAPSLFQLHSDFGNPALRPERSTGGDLGLAWKRRGDTRHAGLTLFRRESENLIGFVSCFGSTTGICANRPFGTYANIGRARSQGFELEAGFEPVAGLGLSAAYAFVDSEDRATGKPLARRPRHAATLSGEWASGKLSLGADLRLVSSSFDDAAGTVRLEGYEVATLRAAWDLGPVELFGRVENLFDERYQTAAGYGTQGRAAFVGVRLR
ncbi:TonB-dependent receptor plug domain-containing protein [Tsuneonella sp. HG222]